MRKGEKKEAKDKRWKNAKEGVDIESGHKGGEREGKRDCRLGGEDLGLCQAHPLRYAAQLTSAGALPEHPPPYGSHLPPPTAMTDMCADKSKQTDGG